MGIEAPLELQSIWEQFVQNNSPELRHTLITAYAPLVRFVVGRLGIPSTGLLETEDLVSYGMIGLINAIDRYDPSRGVRFEAFASVRIRGAVIDQLRTLTGYRARLFRAYVKLSLRLQRWNKSWGGQPAKRRWPTPLG